MEHRLPRLTSFVQVTAIGMVVVGLAMPAEVCGQRHESALPETPARPRLSVASAVPAEPVVTPGPAIAPGERLLADVIDRLESQTTISAKVRHRSTLFGQRLVGSGVYLQMHHEPDPMIRFSLTVQAGEQKMGLLHVSNGRYLSTREQVGATPKLHRIDLKRVRDAMGDDLSTLMDDDFVSLEGGLPRLMRSLQRNFQFSPPAVSQFQGVPVWVLSGRWRPDQLAKLLPKDSPVVQGNAIDIHHLPAQIPDRVFLLIGQDDLFPYHIDFRRSRPLDSEKAVGASGDSIDDHLAQTDSLVTMELFEVQIGAALDPLLFVYKPGDIEIVDLTDDLLDRLAARRARLRNRR